MFTHLAERPELSFGLQTENINGSRVYTTPEGNKYSSVTTVLGELIKADIQKWRESIGEKEANKITGKASRRGTRLHSICESYIKNEDGYLEGQLPDVLAMFQSIEPILKRINNIHGVELGLYSDHLKLAGRTDLIAEFDGRLSVIDYKSSAKRKKYEHCYNYFAQCTAYAIMYEERTTIPIDQVVIIVAVESDEPQLFIEKRDSWVHRIWEAQKMYRENH